MTRRGDDSVMDGLTEKQRRFVEAYAGPAMGNATEAARLAGYSGNDATLSVTGSRMLGNAKIQEALKSVTENTRNAAIADREERMQWLTAVMRGEVTAPKVTSQGDVIEALPPWSDRVKANELLGKMAGDFLEKREVTHHGAEIKIHLPDNGRD